MRLKLLALLSFAFCFQGYSQGDILVEGMPAIRYSLPKASLNFTVEYEKITQKPGVFYLYSQRFLATDQVIQEEELLYRFKGVTMSVESIADAARTFVVSPIPSGTSGLVSLSPNGILKGINLLSGDTVRTVVKQIKKTREPFKLGTNNLLPLTEEYMLASSEAKMAEGAAKQIYHIREARLSLLTGELENMPSDGESLRLMLEGLDQAEAELTSLFVGKTQREVVSKQIIFVPEKPIQDDVLFRFSEKRGIVDASDLGGSPYYLSILADSIVVAPADPKVKLPESKYYSILPVTAKISISDGVQKIMQQEIEVPQFGKLNPLPHYLFKNKNFGVELDTRSGRLVRFTH